MKRSTFSWTLPPGTPLTEAQRVLVTEALEVVPAVVQRVLAAWPSCRRYEDELHSVASEGLIWSVQRYDPAKSSRWKSYAFWGSRIRCLAWLRAARQRDPDVYLDEPMRSGGLFDPDGPPLAERILDSAPGPETLVLQHQVLAALERLPERERLAVNRILEDRTLSEVGAATGRSREIVRRWELSGIRILQEELGLAPRRKRRVQARLDAPEQVAQALRRRPHTTAELRALTGYTRMGVTERMRALGATQVGTTVRNGQRVPLWGFLADAA